jgi:hypothetical protein
MREICTSGSKRGGAPSGPLLLYRLSFSIKGLRRCILLNGQFFTASLVAARQVLQKQEARF